MHLLTTAPLQHLFNKNNLNLNFNSNLNPKRAGMSFLEYLHILITAYPWYELSSCSSRVRVLFFTNSSDTRGIFGYGCVGLYAVNFKNRLNMEFHVCSQIFTGSWHEF